MNNTNLYFSHDFTAIIIGYVEQINDLGFHINHFPAKTSCSNCLLEKYIVLVDCKCIYHVYFPSFDTMCKYHLIFLNFDIKCIYHVYFLSFDIKCRYHVYFLRLIISVDIMYIILG